MPKRDHKQACEDFLDWFAKEKPEWRALPNATGFASNERVHYGTPPGDGKGNGGGGADFFAFGPGGQVEFYEVKTDGGQRLRKNQVIFHRIMTSLGFDCFIFRGHNDGSFEVDTFEDYKYK